MNEPNFLCIWAYGGPLPPNTDESGIADYICGHNILLSHARAYDLYNREFRDKQRGKINVITTGRRKI